MSADPVRCLLVVLAMTSIPAVTLQAQRFVISGGGAVLTGEGFGTSRGCDSDPPASVGVSLRAGRRLGALPAFIEGTVRAHANPFVCVGEFLPPLPGSYVVLKGRNLLAHPFAATDLRIRLRPSVPYLKPSVALGAGKTWRSGYDAPYVLGAGAIALDAGAVQLLFEGEFLRMRLGFDQYQETWVPYQDGTPYTLLVSQEKLGSVHPWRSATLLGITLVVPIGR